MNGLIIKSPWIDYILDGKKTWEIRSSQTHKRGKIALIKSGTGMIYGTAELVDSIPLSLEEYRDNKINHCIPEDTFEGLPYKKTHAWILENPVLFEKPIPYKHPQGAVIWVNLDMNY